MIYAYYSTGRLWYEGRFLESLAAYCQFFEFLAPVLRNVPGTNAKML